MTVDVIILAAGQGKRMHSALPKVLHRLAGRPLLAHVLETARALAPRRIVVVHGHGGGEVRAQFEGTDIDWVEQPEQLGTGHAVKMAQPLLVDHAGPVVIVAGDSPLIQADSLRQLLDHFQKRQPACLLGTLHKPNPAGLGRIVRDAAGEFQGIVEEKDATDEQRRLTEVNMSTYIFAGPELLHALDLLKNDNRQREYYLTDCPGILKSEGKLVEALPVLKPCEALSINTIDELALVEGEMRRLGYGQ